ncbi:MAG TPA: dephospho-CoA kinase [Acidimicrobiales bacterium]|nr:dephospho-CoA kinase [Acidimicrobiales bacterium]
MRRIALSGGIGAGKSAVGDYLASRGYFVVDADAVARHVVEPGQRAYVALRDAFGTAVLTPERTIDRAFLAEVVFHDATALRRLNAITHGQIGLEIAAALDGADARAAFVALPLFRPEHRKLLGLDEVWTVLARPEVALKRLVEHRGMSVEDVTSRMRAQESNEERAASADVVIWNNATLAELFTHVEQLLDQRDLA